jgi:O-antigen/teichoic acid export membrane protein
MQVYTQRASHTVSERVPVLPGLRGSLLALTVLASGLVLTLIIAGPFLFGLVFGSDWTEAGLFARILAIPIALHFITTPLTVLLPPLGRIKGLSLWQVLYFALVLIYSLLPAGSPEHYLQGLAVVESIALILLLLYILRMAKRHDRDLRADDASPAA